MTVPQIKSVTLKNYKSIGAAKVTLAPLTLLVGRNGTGKSNFIDALWLVAEALQSTLDHAIRSHGGINEVRRRSGGHPTHFGVGLTLQLADGRSASYAFLVGATRDGGFEIQRERAAIAVGGLDDAHFDISNGKLTRHSSHLNLAPQISRDRLFLTSASAISEFRQLFDALHQMYFYNINPNEIRQPQPHDAGDVLLRSGRNIASLMRRLEGDNPDAFERVQDYMRQIVPGLEGIEHKTLGPTETLEFRQRVQKSKSPWRFYASAMSDGTLRSLGVLAALFQTNTKSQSPTIVGIEEPEGTIHPGATSVLIDALVEASLKHQVIATTHSPEMLDNEKIGIDNIRVVESLEGETQIEEADDASREAVRAKLFTVGELIRSGQLAPKGLKPTAESFNLFKFD